MVKVGGASAAWRSFRSYDGSGGAFGDTSFKALSSDDSKASVYASLDETTAGSSFALRFTRVTPGRIFPASQAAIKAATTRAS